jgi:hypothetical protein
MSAIASSPDIWQRGPKAENDPERTLRVSLLWQSGLAETLRIFLNILRASGL